MYIINKSMEYVEEKPKKKLLIYVIIGLLILALIVIYFVYFSPAISNGKISSGIIGFFLGKSKDLSLVPDNLQKDVTGGLINLKFDPASVLENPIFKSLHPYAEPVELGTLGRPNPFIPF